MTALLFRALAFGTLVVSLAQAAGPVGWRGDGSGRYPDADPPTQWSADKNVVWKCPLPSWSNATPAVIADRIFVLAEPTDLICVNKADGKIMWKKSNGYDLVMTEQDKAQAEKDKAEADRIRKEEIGPLEKKLKAAREELAKHQPAPAAAAAPAGDPEREESPAEPPAAPPTAGPKPAQGALAKNIADMTKQVKELDDKLAPFNKWQMPRTQPSNGHSSASPVSDGKVVCAVFNTGLAVCYDLEGKLKWARFIDKPPHKSWGSASSPLIYKNMLLVHFVNMRALDLETGKDVWKAADTEWKWGSPVIARVGEVDVAVTAGGDVVRLGDGAVLIKKLCVLTYNAPIVQDGVAYFIQNKGKAVKLSAKGKDELESQALWTTMPKADRYYSSPLCHDGLVYGVTQKGVLSAISAADGKVAAEKELALGKKSVYPSLALGGKYLFVANEDGNSVVLEPGKDFKEVSRNTLETGRSSFVFEGTRMYVRGYKNLYCIGK